jgi:hypothetical protein
MNGRNLQTVDPEAPAKCHLRPFIKRALTMGTSWNVLFNDQWGNSTASSHARALMNARGLFNAATQRHLSATSFLSPSPFFMQAKLLYLISS